MELRGEKLVSFDKALHCCVIRENLLRIFSIAALFSAVSYKQLSLLNSQKYSSSLPYISGKPSTLGYFSCWECSKNPFLISPNLVLYNVFAWLVDIVLSDERAINSIKAFPVKLVDLE